MGSAYRVREIQDNIISRKNRLHDSCLEMTHLSRHSAIGWIHKPELESVLVTIELEYSDILLFDSSLHLW